MDMVDALCCLWGEDAKWESQVNLDLHEAHYLKLDSSKARERLGPRASKTSAPKRPSAPGFGTVGSKMLYRFHLSKGAG